MLDMIKSVKPDARRKRMARTFPKRFHMKAKGQHTDNQYRICLTIF